MEIEQKSKQRIWHLDFIKIIAAFMVVFYHFAYYKMDYGFTQGVTYCPNLNRVMMSLAACSVPLFFMVNGALLFRKHRSWKHMYRKAAKIAVLYFVWSFAEFPGWFFQILALLYILFPLFQFLKEKYKKLYILICGMVFVMPFLYNTVLAVIYSFNPDIVLTAAGHELKHTGLFALYSILYFLLGPAMEDKTLSLSKSILTAAAGWCFLIFECVVYTNKNGAVWDGVNASFPTLGALLLSVGIFMLLKRVRFDKAQKYLMFASDMILPIYLLHMPVINFIKGLTGTFQVNLFTGITGAILICIVCGLTGKILIKIPVLNWFMKM